MKRQTTIFDYLIDPVDELNKKVDKVKSIIKDFHEKSGGECFVSFSGGKDSTVLLHIARSVIPEMPAVFSDTTNEMAEVLRFVKTIDNVEVVRPKITFKEVCETYGFPIASKEVSQKAFELKHTNGVALRYKRLYGDSKKNGRLPQKWHYLAEQRFDVTAKCCNKLKKEPLEQYTKQTGRLPIVGIMEGESRLRQQLKVYGKPSDKKCYPFLFSGFTEEDVWLYADIHGIRFAECYYDRIVDGKLVAARDRTGCEFCGFGNTLEDKDRFERSRAVSPKRYEKFMAIENNGVTFREALDIAKQQSKVSAIGIFGVDTAKPPVVFESDSGQKTTLLNLRSTTKTKVCPCCGSRRLSTMFGHYGNYADAPDPTTGAPRRVFVESGEGKVCDDCGATVTADLHLFNGELGVTQRFIDYVYRNMTSLSVSQITEESGVDVDTVIETAMFAYKHYKKGTLPLSKAPAAVPA